MKLTSLIYAISAMVLMSASALAQNCTSSPSCSSLGYNQTAAQCTGKTIVKCPFDVNQVFCGGTTTCADLGYTMSAAQCAGRRMAKCPDDISKVICDKSSVVGEIRIWPSATAPIGWKICDGSALSTTTYSALYSVIGTTFGGYSGNFYLPNLKGRVGAGVGTDGNSPTFTYVLGKSGGKNFVQLESHNIPDHKHLTGWGEASGDRYGRFGSNNQIGMNATDHDNYQYYSGYMTSRSGYYNPPTDGNSDYFQYVSQSYPDDRNYSATVSYHENRIPFLTINYIIYTGVY